MENEIFEKVFTAESIPLLVQGEEFHACTFEGCDLSDIAMDKASFIGCKFHSCNLGNVKLTGSVIDNTAFIDCKLLGVDFSQCDTFLFSATFEKCMLNYASFVKMPLKNIIFKGCELRETDFSDADLSGASLIRCNLAGAQFNRTNLEKADLRSAWNYIIDPVKNRLRKTKVSWPGVEGLLVGFGVVISSEETVENIDDSPFKNL